MLNSKRVLVLCPHPDDLEFGCGGTVARLVEEGASVTSIIFTIDRIRMGELIESSDALHVQPVAIGRFAEFTYLEIRRMDERRQDILDQLLNLKDHYKPDLVIQPSLHDIHQDHQTVAQEGLRAFKDTNLIGYEAAWNNLNFEAQLFVSLKPEHLNKKIEAIKCYKSQAHKPYASEDYIRSLAKVRGTQAGVNSAEMFSVIRQVVR